MAEHPSLTEFAKGQVLAEGTVTVTGAECCMWDYMGKSPVSSPALHLTLVDADGEPHDNYYSAGKEEDFTPSADGKTLDIVGTRKMYHEQTNISIFLVALMEAGFPAKSLNPGDFTFLVGLKGHMITKTVQRTGGNVAKETALLVFDRIDELPGQPAKSGKTTTPSVDAEPSAVAVIEAVLVDNDGEIARKSLLGLALKTDVIKGLNKATRTATINLLKDEDFLRTQISWTYDKNTLSYTG